MKKELEDILINKYPHMFQEYKDSLVKMTKHNELNKDWHRDMTPEEKVIMKKKREDIGCFQPIAFGIETDDGWFKLLDDLMNEISKVDTDKTITIHQIKEKFGGLRFYTGEDIRLDVLNDASYALNRDSKSKEIYDLIDKAEAESYKICEICGKPGRLCSSGAWLKTICKEHRGTNKEDGNPIYKPTPRFHNSETIIVNNEYTSTIINKKFDETSDTWIYTIEKDNLELPETENIKHIPYNNFYVTQSVGIKDYPEQEYTVTTKNFVLKDGWLYNLSHKFNNTTVINAKEESLINLGK